MADSRVVAVLQARSHDPFEILGQHRTPEGWEIRAYLPQAERVFVRTQAGEEPLERIFPDGLFARRASDAVPTPYVLVWEQGGHRLEGHDPYCFDPQLSDFDLYLFGQGKLLRAYGALGAHGVVVDGVAGVRFATWAPNAERVSVVGDFNDWDGRRHPMRVRGSSGVWELFLPGIGTGCAYKFEIRNRQTGAVFLKTDPYARAFERRPKTAAVVEPASDHVWGDSRWMSQRPTWDWHHRPLNCYEVHLGSWRRGPGGDFLTYEELAAQLAGYVQDLGFTHVELLPVSEHPLDESWGYQTTGYFAPTSRFGRASGFRAFVDRLHQAGLGVIVDWVPAHFPTDDWALARFDGTPLYEHEDPRRALHPDWGTYIFNYGRNEVRNFLIANALFWLDEFHVDGLRVDAVASMLYLDYSRKEGQWIPNRFGGRENLEAIDFLRELNALVHGLYPGALTIAEESTAWPLVSRPSDVGGLGFSMKWNMGWMNDTLRFFARDPIHRRHHLNDLTFSQLYAYSENFVLPLSHDEVVHGKRSLVDKMPGDPRQRFAGVRLLLTYQMTQPGKKLNFMGNEFAHGAEWDATRQLDWELLDVDWHAGVRAAFKDLSRLYAQTPALHAYDFEQRGFEWIDCHDAPTTTISYLRWAGGSFVAVVLNFTPIAREGYRLGVPAPGRYREIFNSDSRHYGGSDLGNGAGLQSEALSWMGRPHSVVMTLPPLAGVILALE